MKDVMIEILEGQIQEMTDVLQNPNFTHQGLIEAAIIRRAEKRKELAELKNRMNTD